MPKRFLPAALAKDLYWEEQLYTGECHYLQWLFLGRSQTSAHPTGSRRACPTLTSEKLTARLERCVGHPSLAIASPSTSAVGMTHQHRVVCIDIYNSAAGGTGRDVFNRV